jgi:phosphatidylinositol 3-kinase
LKCLNDVVKATGRESGGRDKKVVKLRSFLNETSKSSSAFDLVDFYVPIPLISDPSVKIIGVNVDKTTMFKSNLMPCKFVFKTLPDINMLPDQNKSLEYSVIYKIGDDLRQDQLVLQMIALMDKLLKQENLDLKLTPYKVVATGIKEGFLQFIDALPVSNILANSEYRTIKEYLRKNNPSDSDKHGVLPEAMDNYVRSCGKIFKKPNY